MQEKDLTTLTRRRFIAASAITLFAAGKLNPASAKKTRKLLSGVDISWLPEVERYRKNFFTRSRKPLKAIKLLKYQGVKVGRIRVFVNPDSENGDLDRAIDLAKRLKKSNLQICIDLHYSDTWADPGHQTTPAGWSTTSIEDLEDSVYNYTKQTLRKFKAAGVTPEWVQLGNEISNGMMWPLGQINSSDATQWQNLSRIHQAATNALRQVAPNAKSILHLDCGGDYNRVKWWLEQADQYNLTEYDIVGVSFYSQWHGELSDLQSVLNLIAKERKQKVLIAETAYPWIAQSFGSDVININHPPLTDCPYTKSGQANYVKKLQNMLLALPQNRGLGIWWWEGLATKVESNNQIFWNGGMANSTLVDTDRTALPALIQLGLK
ncbi:MAG: hypothetical protein RLZZ508_1271 [Actinomycetota bacterium]